MLWNVTFTCKDCGFVEHGQMDMYGDVDGDDLSRVVDAKKCSYCIHTAKLAAAKVAPVSNPIGVSLADTRAIHAAFDAGLVVESKSRLRSCPWRETTERSTMELQALLNAGYRYRIAFKGKS